MENYLHLIAAAQAKADFKRLTSQKMKPYTKLKFISSKKEGKEVSEKKTGVNSKQFQISHKLKNQINIK